MGILAGLCGAGLIIGGLAMLIPMMGQVDVFGKNGKSSELLNEVLKLDNATAVMRWSHLLATPFMFLLPALLYARICHVDAIKHVGLNHGLDLKLVILVILIMLAAIPAVTVLQQLTEMLPWSKGMQLKFELAEENYRRQVGVLAKMDGATDYLVTLVIVALLPAVFEEIMFRGCFQNLLSRWFNHPLLALVIVSALFSAVHGSYLGFLSRFALGFVLGWMYYRTGNLWLNIIGHFFNNAAAVTLLYGNSKPGIKPDLSNMGGSVPLWAGLLSVAAVTALFIAFEKLGKEQIHRPGEEVLLPGYHYNNNPFINDTGSGQEGSQQ